MTGILEQIGLAFQQGIQTGAIKVEKWQEKRRQQKEKKEQIREDSDNG